MNELLLTHKDLADMLGVSETTVKSYRRKFPGCIPVANQGKPIRFAPEAAQVAKRIRALFVTGMSIDEVRLRLSQEFAWITPEYKQPPRQAETSDRGEASPELTVGVSNMAKSMVAMAQQQKAILHRMQGIEAMLEELGLNVGQGALDDARKKQRQLAQEKEARLESRLDQLDAATQELMETVGAVAGQLDQFFSHRNKAQETWKQGGAASTLAEASTVTGQEQTASAAGEAAPGGKIIPFAQGTAPRNTVPEKSAVPGPGAPGKAGVSEEPPRTFLTFPLVVRTAQGQYISAGGRSRGRFCLTDLKAMLIYGFAPPHHYTLRWESHGQGWWLVLEQPEKDGGKSLHLLLMEVPTQKGTSVVDILQVKHDNTPVHPAEICAILDSLTE